MLFLLFQIREDWYALDAAHVVEVLPLVKFKPLLDAPPGLAGVFSYHGTPIPLIDLSTIIAGTSTRVKMSTRLILVQHTTDSGVKLQMGLLVEELMETFRRMDTDFDSVAIVAPSACLGPITMDGERIIHRIEIGGLLSGALCDRLLPQRPVHE